MFLSSSFLSIYLIFIPILVLSISGCSGEQQTKLAYIKGTLAWRQGNWNNAVLYFYEAESLAAELPDENMAQYTDSALASAYLMQGEDTAASRKLENISETAPDILRAHRFYQQGIIAFRAKEYAQAAALFRKSLELSGGDMAAKINYELSKKLSDTQREMQHQAPQNAAEDPESNLTDSIILDIIRKREQNEWEKMQHESEPAINDY
ncbi:tetratricopeptide repeat protein [Treponema vincentii ATCC 35580]|uniref:Tetratricopeptide repeat protein n=1 Tax=Treponema vincentii ATCC 35580 TaxID=596324 RepID=C8PMA8_9SPIR|nr:tetratricopeptide repeat protein [Treponema vincentii ATCC 35580]